MNIKIGDYIKTESGNGIRYGTVEKIHENGDIDYKPPGKNGLDFEWSYVLRINRVHKIYNKRTNPEYFL